MIAIVDYGAGNLASVRKAFDHLGADVVVTKRAEDVAKADKVVLPGVGHFSSLEFLDREGLGEVLRNGVRDGRPFLGICLGMQWLFEGSEESPEVRGAGLFPGRCRHFPVSVQSPHVGWNALTVRESSFLLAGIATDSFVYYTHSFHAPIIAGTTASTEYGVCFSGAVERDNVFGVQFHPEKSGEVGLRMLKNFCELR